MRTGFGGERKAFGPGLLYQRQNLRGGHMYNMCGTMMFAAKFYHQFHRFVFPGLWATRQVFLIACWKGIQFCLAPPLSSQWASNGSLYFARRAWLLPVPLRPIGKFIDAGMREKTFDAQHAGMYQFFEMLLVAGYQSAIKPTRSHGACLRMLPVFIECGKRGGNRARIQRHINDGGGANAVLPPVWRYQIPPSRYGQARWTCTCASITPGMMTLSPKSSAPGVLPARMDVITPSSKRLLRAAVFHSASIVCCYMDRLLIILV